MATACIKFSPDAPLLNSYVISRISRPYSDRELL